VFFFGNGVVGFGHKNFAYFEIASAIRFDCFVVN
jgi:hypothetical protein